MKVWLHLSSEHSGFDLDTIRMPRGHNLLHIVATTNLTGGAEDILSQGYRSLLEKPATDGKQDWPLLFAVQARNWKMVKIFMEAMNPK